MVAARSDIAVPGFEEREIIEFVEVRQAGFFHDRYRDVSIDRDEATARITVKKLATLALLAIALTALAPNGASARPGKPDDIPCGDPYHESIVNGDAQICPLTQNRVPVYESFEDGFFGDNDIVGYLNNADGNFFMCQLLGEEFDIPGTNISNDFWALTLADNGAAGWVPEVYFAGGGNFQPDANLVRC
jgi:hypothetical protein